MCCGRFSSPCCCTTSTSEVALACTALLVYSPPFAQRSHWCWWVQARYAPGARPQNDGAMKHGWVGGHKLNDRTGDRCWPAEVAAGDINDVDYCDDPAFPMTCGLVFPDTRELLFLCRATWAQAALVRACCQPQDAAGLVTNASSAVYLDIEWSSVWIAAASRERCFFTDRRSGAGRRRVDRFMTRSV